MRYYKQILDGYILVIGTGNGFEEISESEYNTILFIIRNKPATTETTDYHLREDLTWEEYQVPPTPEPEPTDEDKAEAYDILIGEEG